MRHFLVFASMLILLLSCNRIKNKSAVFADSAKSKSKKLLSKAIDNLPPVSDPDSVSIKDFVPAFKQSRSIKEIKGVHFDIYMFNVNFFVYRASREIVLKGVSNIQPEKTFDIKSDSICTPIDDSEVLKMGVPEDHNQYVKFFWHFKQLQKMQAFRCVKGHWRHYIIFDNNSDTVYHEIEEIRD